MWLQPLSKGASLLAGGLASSVHARPVHPDVQLRADSLPILWKSIYEASQERKKNREIIAASSFAESVVCSGAAAQRQAQPFAQRTSVNTLKICNWVTLIGRFCIPREYLFMTHFQLCCEWVEPQLAWLLLCNCQSRRKGKARALKRIQKVSTAVVNSLEVASIRFTLPQPFTNSKLVACASTFTGEPGPTLVPREWGHQADIRIETLKLFAIKSKLKSCLKAEVLSVQVYCTSRVSSSHLA